MDDADFERIDVMVFDRIHHGSLQSVVAHLKDGRTVTGEVLAIRRSNAVGRPGAAPMGELCLLTASGRIVVPYDQIGDIS
jgi:hypothetical protein